MRTIPTIVALLGLAAAPAALAQGCCEGKASAQAGCAMSHPAATAGHEGCAGMPTATANPASATAIKAFKEPVQAVYDNYLTVQASLAQDSLKDVSATATAMAKAIQGDTNKTLPPAVARQAESLAKAKDLAAARDAFKSLSESLIQHLTEQKVPAGIYYVAYCPMAKASWLQTSKVVVNPYLGMSMIHCGQIKS